MLFAFSRQTLTFLGEFLVLDKKPEKAGAVVVLNTGLEYFPRLIEAADLYRRGFAAKIVINGNRKTEAFRSLEVKGFRPCCLWYEDRIRILELFDVPRQAVIAISAEDAYDTVSEAELVGKAILKRNFAQIIITTSKSHTKRAHFIWQRMYKNRLTIIPVSAKTDPFDPKGWWKHGRQIRWVLSEYGAWIFYFLKNIKEG
ncbi:YdcF family protein [Thermodesulfobacteriota bacterium]